MDSISNYEYGQSLDLALEMQNHSKAIAAVWSKMEPETSKTDINRRASKMVIQIIVSALHDAMKVSIAGEKSIINFDQERQIAQLGGRWSAEELAEKIQDSCQGIRWIDASVNEKLIFEQILLNLAVSDTMGVSR